MRPTHKAMRLTRKVLGPAVSVIALTISAGNMEAQTSSRHPVAAGASRTAQARPATWALLDLSAATLTWKDSNGHTTRGPSASRILDLLSQGRLDVTGSVAERIERAGSGNEIAAATTTIQFASTSADEPTLNEARDIVAERIGAMEESRIPSFVFDMIRERSGQQPATYHAAPTIGRVQSETPVQQRSSQSETERDRQRRADAEQRQRENDRIIRETKNLPEQIIRDGVQDAATQVRWQLRAKINQKVDKILRRGR